MLFLLRSIKDVIVTPLLKGAVSILRLSKKTLIGDLELPLTLNIKTFTQNLKNQLLLLTSLRFGGVITGKEDDEVFVKEFGLFGWLTPWPINVTVIRPQVNSSPELIKTLLEKVDSQKCSRSAFQPFNRLIGGPHFLAQGGEQGLRGHKTFSRALPKRKNTYLITIATTIEALKQSFAMGEKVDFWFLKGLVRSILTQLLLGCRLSESMDNLVEKIEPILLYNHKLDIKIKQEYAKLLQDIIHDRVSNPESCMLSNMLNEKFSALDKDDKQKQAMTDPDIAVLPTILVVANNVSRLLNNVLGQIVYADLDVLKTEMQEKSVSVLDESCSQMDEKITQLKVLDNIVKEGLRLGGFDPAIIYRYTSKAIKIENTRAGEETTIPAHSWIAIHHRALIDRQKSFDIHEQPNAPQLNTQSFSPFSLGIRQCPGQRLAQDIAKGIFLVMVEMLDKKFWTTPYNLGRAIEFRKRFLNEERLNDFSKTFKNA